MTNLEQPNLSYVILSSDKLEDMISILYAKEYKVVPIKGYYRGQYENSAIAFSNVDNDTLRKDIVFVLDHFKENSAIIKYSEESVTKRIYSDGSEKIMEVVMYNTDFDNISYLYNGYSFSFIESKRYWKPSKREDFKSGMLVEYFSNNKWFEKTVTDVNDEYDKMYKLLIKYDKIRVLSK